MAFETADINAIDSVELAGPDVRPFCNFSMPERSVAKVKINITVIRTSDGAAKSWSTESLMRRSPGGNAIVLESIPTPPNLFATAGDETALAGCTIALYAEQATAGAQITTPAGNFIWFAKISGQIVTFV
jgi:hypothetical protein